MKLKKVAKKFWRINSILRVLDNAWPSPEPFLSFKSPFESLVATILSAQCTDARVNIVTQKLFPVANTPQKIIALGVRGLIPYIRSTGFFNAKARNIVKASQKIITEFNGEVPNDLELLQKLPGVGRKTASVVLCQAFHVPTFPVDRHVLRVANRLALAHAKTPDKTDIQLRAVIPQEKWSDVHLQLILLGRSYCRPKPKCVICPLLKYCPEGQRRTNPR